MIPIVDSHLDLAWNALSFNRDLTLPLDQLRAKEAHMTDLPCRGRATTSLPELRRAGVRVCLATLLARGGPAQQPQEVYLRTDLDHANQTVAHAVAHGQLAYYRALAREGEVRFIHTARELSSHWRDAEAGTSSGQALGIILSMEGADPILDPSEAEAWWEAGLRVASLAHYGRSHYAFGTGVEGSLSETGKTLLREFEQLGMVLDVTHFSDQSFHQALDVFRGPVLASHHNCRTLVPHQRQLDDQQIRLLLDRGAVIGVSLDAWMLYPGWERGVTDPGVLSLESVADQIDYVCQLSGSSQNSGIGSDLDGGFGNEQTPGDLHSVTDLQKLTGILEGRGYSGQDVQNIFHGNWIRFFDRWLP